MAINPHQATASPRTMDDLISVLKRSLYFRFCVEPRYNLLRLPQEIQDMIFHLAYARFEGWVCISPRTWEIREKQLRRLQWDSPYDLRPCPPPKVSELLVSKTFFLAASKAFIQSTTWDIATQSHLLDHSVRDVMFSKQPGIAKQLVSSMTLTLSDWAAHSSYLIENLPSLKVLVINVGLADFEAVEPRWVWEVDLNLRELATVLEALKLPCSIRIIGVSIVASARALEATDVQKATWERNVANLGVLLQSAVMKPGHCEDLHRVSARQVSKSAPTTLYRGSKVYFASPDPKSSLVASHLNAAA